MAADPTTRQQAVYEQLRSEILSGNLQPGQRLRFAELVARCDTSVGVLREALARLAEQGLVRSEPQRGFLVTPISRQDLIHLTEARREIETLTLRRAIAEGDLRWESDVLSAHHRLTGTAIADDGDPRTMSDEWAQAHADFHDTLLAGCGNPRLIEIARDLRAAAELYRRLSVQVAGKGSRDIAAEHKAIADAVLAREAEHAAALLAAHIDRTAATLLGTDVLCD